MGVDPTFDTLTAPRSVCCSELVRMITAIRSAGAPTEIISMVPRAPFSHRVSEACATAYSGMETRWRIDSTSQRASRRVPDACAGKAQRFNHNYIGTDTSSWDLVREGEGSRARCSPTWGRAQQGVRRRVHHRARDARARRIGLTPRATKVIELAVDEARA